MARRCVVLRGEVVGGRRGIEVVGAKNAAAGKPRGVRAFAETAWLVGGLYLATAMRRGDRVLVAGQVHAEAWTDSDRVKRMRRGITDAAIGAARRFTTIKVALEPSANAPRMRRFKVRGGLGQVLI